MTLCNPPSNQGCVPSLASPFTVLPWVIQWQTSFIFGWLYAKLKTVESYAFGCYVSNASTPISEAKIICNIGYTLERSLKLPNLRKIDTSIIQGDWLVTLPLFLRKSKTLFVVEYCDWSHVKDNFLVVIVLEFHWSREIIFLWNRPITKRPYFPGIFKIFWVYRKRSGWIDLND